MINCYSTCSSGDDSSIGDDNCCATYKLDGLLESVVSTGLSLLNSKFGTSISIDLSFIAPSSFVDYVNTALQAELKTYSLDGDIVIYCMPKSMDKKKLIMIIVIAVGGAGLILLIILIVFCSVRHCACCKKQNRVHFNGQ